MLTIAEIDRLRALENEWLTAEIGMQGASREQFARELFRHAHELLAAAAALMQISAIARDETDLGDFSRRVGVVLAELERGR